MVSFHLVEDPRKFSQLEQGLPIWTSEWETRRRSRKWRVRPPNPPDSVATPNYFHRDAQSQEGGWKTVAGHHQELCGIHAQRAAQEYPNHYPPHTVLNAESRVIVTGALSSMGLHLILALSERCGVKQILGMDAVVPNTRRHRMKQMKRYALLKRFVPGLHKLLVPLVGIEPKADLDRARLQRFSPTHVVHLASHSIDSENKLYTIREKVVAMEQLLRYTQRHADSRPPHFVYIGTESMEYVLSRSFMGLFGVKSVRLRLPSVYGPWGEDGSDVRVAVQERVFNFSDPNAPAQQIVDGTKSFLFVDDVVEALLAAMQFQWGDSDFLLSSGTTLSSITASLTDDFENFGDGADKGDVTGNYSVPLLGWEPTTSTAEGIRKVISHEYTEQILFDTKNLTSFELTKQPYVPSLPCASECSDHRDCNPTGFDRVLGTSQNATQGCVYVVYVLNPTPAEFARLPDYTGNQTDVCALALVSEIFPAAWNHTRGWRMVVMPPSTGLLESLLPKVSPQRMFAASVVKVMYVEPRGMAIPSAEELMLLVKRLDSRSRKLKERSSGPGLLFRTYKEPAKTTVLFGQLYNFTAIANKPILAHAEQMMQQNSVPPSPLLRNQVQFYEHAAHLVQTTARRPFIEISHPLFPRFPMQWVRSNLLVHELFETESRRLRCEWYQEHAYWGNQGMEDLSLAFVLARRSVEGRQGPAMNSMHDVWIPLAKVGDPLEPPEKLRSANNGEMILRFIKH